MKVDSQVLANKIQKVVEAENFYKQAQNQLRNKINVLTNRKQALISFFQKKLIDNLDEGEESVLSAGMNILKATQDAEMTLPNGDVVTRPVRAIAVLVEDTDEGMYVTSVDLHFVRDNIVKI